MENSRPSGCFSSLLLVVFLVTVLFQAGGKPSGEGLRRPPIDEPRSDPGSMPIPEYGIEDTGKAQDSQGTAFAISSKGLWLTAEHVVRGCDLVGLATGPQHAEKVSEVYQSQVSDAALIADGFGSRVTMPLAMHIPEEGAAGYHMGFPSGRPAVVQSRLIGPGSAVRGLGRTEPVLAWAEVRRFPEFDHALGGISGGPTLDFNGAVVGINSAASERRGRVLTTRPDAAINLVRAARRTHSATAVVPIAGLDDAIARFDALAHAGAIRQVFCDVAER